MTGVLTMEDRPAYFARLADVEATHWWSRAMWRIAARWLNQALRGRGGLAALDIGCGTGMTAVRLAARSEIDSVVGLDPCPDALEHARLRHDFSLVLGDALHLPFDTNSFDVLTCFDVLQHLPSGGARIASAEMARVLRPGGVALVRSNAAPLLRPYSGGGYRLPELNELFTASGFRVERSSYVNTLPALAQELRGLFSRNHPGHPSGAGLRIRVPSPVVNEFMNAVAQVEALALSAVGRLPFGHSTLKLLRNVP